MADWSTLFRPVVSQWVLGDLEPGRLPDRVLLPCENPDYYDDGDVAAKLQGIEDSEHSGRFLIGTFGGRRLAVARTSKFGGPSVAMAVDVLAAAGAKLIVGLGYAGGLQSDIACGDLVIVTGAVRDEGTTARYVSPMYPAVADPSVVSALRDAARDAGLRSHTGLVWTTDAVLREDDAQVGYWHRAGVVAVDMETAALLTVAALGGAAAGVVLVASDNPWLKRFTDLEKLRAGYRRALEVCLTAMSRWPGTG